MVPYRYWRSFKILVGFWLIPMVVLINAYTGVMTALLTVPKLEAIANTLEEAVVQDRLVTIQTSTLMSRIILVFFPDMYIIYISINCKPVLLHKHLKSATEGYEKTIGDQYRQDPTLWTIDSFMAADNVLRRKCVYPTVII